MRLLVRYTISKYNESGLVGIDLSDFDHMMAVDIQEAIERGICKQYNNVNPNEVKIDVIEYLGAMKVKPDVAPPSPDRSSRDCLVCGGNHGNSGLPCPHMSASSTTKLL